LQQQQQQQQQHSSNAVSAENILQQVVAIFYFLNAVRLLCVPFAGILIYLLIFTMFSLFSRFQFRFAAFSTVLWSPDSAFIKTNTFHSSSEERKLS